MLTESPLYGVPVEVIAAKCQVHPDTARRWKRTGHVPAAAVVAIRALHEHDLGVISEAWAGWSVRGDALVSPAGERFTPGAVLAGKYHAAMVRELQKGKPKPIDFGALLEES